MKKSILKILFATSCATSILATTAFAGQWIENRHNWYYMTDDDHYAKDTFLWLDENHDGKAEFYHFNEDGVMSKSTSFTINNDYSSATFYFDENGAATKYSGYIIDTYIEEIIQPVGMPEYSIIYKDGKYEYLYNDDKSHYDFKDVDHAYTKPLVDCGDYYSSEVGLIIKELGGMSTVLDVMDCYVPGATAYFTKDCMWSMYTMDGEEVMPLSEFLSKERYHHDGLIVKSTNSDGYITSCTLMSWG